MLLQKYLDTHYEYVIYGVLLLRCLIITSII